MDFYQIRTKQKPKNVIEVYADFKVGRSRDLMVRGKSFYAIWDEARQIWSTDEYDVQRLVDEDLAAKRDELAKETESEVTCRFLRTFANKAWKEFRDYVSHVSDNASQLDVSVTFANTPVKKSDHVSKRVSYNLAPGSIESYDELMSVLYEPEERDKLEWAIGAILSGDAKSIQKFIVLFGDPGSGKSTFLNIVEKLFEGYTTTFEAKALTSSSNAFSMEAFRSNPLVAIQHDGDLSRIEDNTKLNSIVSHEYMQMNEKFKPAYPTRINAMLFMGTNKPVKITDAKSGLPRRLLDVHPTGKKVPPRRYQTLIAQIDFELGAIADYCLKKYYDMGKNYYNGYIPLDMMYKTDVFFNFVESYYHVFKEQDGVSLKQAYEMYKSYCDEALVDFKLPRHKFREELKSYFQEFYERGRTDGEQVRSYFTGFLTERFTSPELKKESKEKQRSLILDSKESIFDASFSDCPAQYASSYETPKKKWVNVTTTLKDIDTGELHYVKVPTNHIVIDFDIKGPDGEKSLEANLDAASNWPPTYAEYSKSGKGIHLHYIYDEDPMRLQRVYSEGIEIKVFTGDSSLRRKLTQCNTREIAHISGGLPLKGDDAMTNNTSIKTERGLRELITRNLNKEIHPGTKPSIDFIKKILDDAYDSGLAYDVSDMQTKVLSFAAHSTNQADYCIKLVSQMKFASEKPSEPGIDDADKPLVFFDVEVFPNLFIVIWKEEGEDKKCVKMINPTPSEIEQLFSMKLVGFNNRRYDNHILYGRFIGYNNEQIYNLSTKLVGKVNSGLFREAYNISHTDVYDFSSKKQSLKKFEIELGIHHQELGYDWTQPVPEELWEKVADYCVNDVIATEMVFNARKQDYIARQILADISGLSCNHTTQQHTAKIIFGDDQNPQEKFIYTDLSEMFPGYTFDPARKPKSLYRGEDPSEGGYVYAEPGMYSNVAILDVQSMHPSSLRNMNAFGPYTENFNQLIDSRLAIKHEDYETAKKMLGGVLEKYLTSTDAAEELSYALKIVINIVYGLTSASFPNKFLDPKNKDNIVAKRGALFMIDLKHAVQEMGYKVIHIKTDSIKVPDADDKIINFIKDFGTRYGYSFAHEATYEKMCLVNNAVYIAKYGWSEKAKNIGKWTATGAQFAHPYLFKTLFSRDPIIFEDLIETKEVTTALYLDMNEDLPAGEHNYVHVGKVGAFVPMLPGCGAGELMRIKDEKYYAAGGTKGYRWMEAEVVKAAGIEQGIDMSYYRALVDDALEDIGKFGDVEWFVGDDIDYTPNYPIGLNDHPRCRYCDQPTCDGTCQLSLSAQTKEFGDAIIQGIQDGLNESVKGA